MATQHPDNACPVYFLNSAVVSSKDEVEECYRCFSDFGVEEYMWDWEGKFVDEAVIDRLYSEYSDYFKKHQLGKDVFLTFRIPNIWIESNHKLPRAFMNVLSAEKAADMYHFYSPPLFEIILPMTTKASQLIYLQKSFHKIAKATEEIFEMKSALKTIDIIPLFERFDIMHDCKKILHTYVDFLAREYHVTPSYLRIFTARSDTAVNGGFLPAKLAIKLAVTRYYEFEKETGIKVFPWVGGGCLPFRGGMNPENIPAALDEYRGMATLTVQSAFRYDYDLPLVRKAIATLNREIPRNQSRYDLIPPNEAKILMDFNRKVMSWYTPTVEALADIINAVAVKLPSHRERVQHIGLFGYSRGVGSVKLPRAITFTGSLYSLGIPPELIASGRALALASEWGILPLIHKYCPYLREDFLHAGHYLNRENLELLSKRYPLIKHMTHEIDQIQKILNIEIGPSKPSHIIHRNATSNIYQKLRLDEDFSFDVLSAAAIRKSLG